MDKPWLAGFVHYLLRYDVLGHASVHRLLLYVSVSLLFGEAFAGNKGELCSLDEPHPIQIKLLLFKNCHLLAVAKAHLYS